MYNIEICEFELPIPSKSSGKLAIFSCAIEEENPKARLDDAVSSYVERKLHNQFIDINLKNVRKRLIIFEINELEYKDYHFENSEDCEIFESNLINDTGNKYAKLTIIRGGLKSENPISYMKSVVRHRVKSEIYQEYTEIHLDNPWVRVLLTEFENTICKPFNF